VAPAGQVVELCALLEGPLGAADRHGRGLVE
jgi:hypothetical protein